MRLILVVAGVTGALLLILLTDPIPQDPAYHAFADQRSYLGVPNFLDVVSNLPFLFVGAWGLRILATSKSVVRPELRTAWFVFFAGIALTALGSSWYHYDPTNITLVWDRLPMTIAFMSLVAIVAGEYFDPVRAQKMLPLLLAAGAASVLYWAWGEARGIGDLRPYAIVQFLPMLVIPVVLWLRGKQSRLTSAFWWMIGAYLLAKVFEYFDPAIYATTDFISGHSLKHLSAALAPLVLLLAIRRTATPLRSSP